VTHSVECPGCRAPNAPAARFCDQCGNRLPVPEAGVAEARTPSPAAPGNGSTPGHEAAPVGDRRIVTALFADLVDYVRMFAEHDAEEVKGRVDAALAAMDDAVVRFGGSREKFIGDAIFAVFGHPRARDDDPLRAALCALAIRAALADLAESGEEPLAIRIGVATGEVVAAPRIGRGANEISLTGPAVVIAARIQGLAGPGEILLDEATLRSARGRLAVEERGTRRLRGRPGPVHLYALLADRGIQAAVQPTGRLLGRATERARLRGLLDAVRTTGLGQVGVVVGEAGMGKTRLLADLRADARAAGLRWTWTENVSYGTGEPYRFVRTFAQAIADEENDDSGAIARRFLFTDDLDDQAARRIGGGIAAIAREAGFAGWEAEEPYTPADPVEAMKAILEACQRYTVRLAEELGPRVVVIDDLHWVDPSSLPVIDQLVTVTPSIPFAVLLAMRPGPHADAMVRGVAERIELAGLGPEDTSQLAAEVGGAELAPRDAAAVHERTGGNPLFVAETVRALTEDGSLVLRDGRLAMAAGRSPSKLPDTLRALLGARIDALSGPDREAVGVASVIGMRFPTRLVAELLGRPAAPVVFERLVDAALIEPLDEGDTWRFSHPLIRDAAYAGLLTSRRRTLHGILADRLAETGRAGIGQIARHRVAAGEVERAVPLLDQAARAAMTVGAVSEAAGFWATAAELAPSPADRTAFSKAASEALAAAGVGREAPA
jgi:class 3 adenylate cyclase